MERSKDHLYVIDEGDNETHSAILGAAIDESIIKTDPNGNLTDYLFEGEGEGDDEMTEMVKRSNTSNDSVEKDITFVSQLDDHVNF